MSDLISRSALIQHAFTAEFDGKPIDVVALADVDNAPTVDPQQVVIFSENMTKKEKQKLISEFKAVMDNAKLTVEPERPKGEWIICYTAKQKKVAACNLCNCISVQGKTNFCHNCGADMRGDNGG